MDANFKNTQDCCQSFLKTILPYITNLIFIINTNICNQVKYYFKDGLNSKNFDNETKDYHKIVIQDLDAMCDDLKSTMNKFHDKTDNDKDVDINELFEEASAMINFNLSIKNPVLI